MKKLDAGYWMLIVATISFVGANLVGKWLVALVLPTTLLPFASLFVHIFEGGILLIIAIVFAVILGKTANDGASYDTVDACVQDINKDVRATIFMVLVTVLILAIPLGMYYGALLTNDELSIYEYISKDTLWSYGIAFVFLIVMTSLRNWERRMTVQNCLKAMNNIDTMTTRRTWKLILHRHLR